MKILAIDSSAASASVSIVTDGKITAESYINTKLTHSTTLMPMIVSMLKCSEESLSAIDYFAVSAGPGSFTGLRIGVATIKGIAMAEDKPCAAVSTLEATAYNFTGTNGIICAVMDARCSQFYNGIFKAENGSITRLCADRAISCDDLAADLINNYAGKNIILAGDGGSLAYSLISPKISNIEKAPEHLLFQRASGVAFAAEGLISNGNTVTAAQLVPTYLRLPQAQRELKKRQAAENSLK